MESKQSSAQALSPWWRYGVVLTIFVGMTVLVFMSATAYTNAPPIPQGVVGPSGEIVFTGKDIPLGQEVFLKYGLMENGTIWGHGAYLGPDFSAEYLHTLGLHCGELVARRIYKWDLTELSETKREAVNAEVGKLLKTNHYDPKTKTLIFTPPESHPIKSK